MARLVFSGLKLNQARQHKNLTQEELGQASGVGRYNISRWESDFCAPNPAALIALAEALGIDPATLFERSE